MTDDGIISIYTDALIALSELTREAKHLAKPDAVAKAVSPICGSEVTIELKLDNGKITDVGYEIEACALTRAVVAVLRQAAMGKTREDVAGAGRAMAALLAEGAKIPAGDWEQLNILAPVKDYPSRHNALLLPFEAAGKALKG